MATGICPFCGKTVDKFIMFRGDVVGCRYCGIHTKKTKADRIRAMTDEELSEWIERIRLLCANDACGQACPLKEICYSKAVEPTETLDWLKSPAEEGET